MGDIPCNNCGVKYSEFVTLQKESSLKENESISEKFIRTQNQYNEALKELNDYFIPKMRDLLKEDNLESANELINQIPSSVTKSLAIDMVHQYSKEEKPIITTLKDLLKEDNNISNKVKEIILSKSRLNYISKRVSEYLNENNVSCEFTKAELKDSLYKL